MNEKKLIHLIRMKSKLILDVNIFFCVNYKGSPNQDFLKYSAGEIIKKFSILISVRELVKKFSILI